MRPKVDVKRLAELREERGWTQSKLAEESGLSTQFISDLSTGGRRGRSASTRKALADALDVPVSEITVHEETPAKASPGRESSVNPHPDAVSDDSRAIA